MKLRILQLITILFVLTISAASAVADTYDKFTTTRYYSSNQKYFVEINEKRRASLYRNMSRPQRLWKHTLPELPRNVLITDDGRRVAIIDGYYGNAPKMPVVILLDENGQQIADYKLEDVANISRVIHSSSRADWYDSVAFSTDARFLLVQTIVAKHEDISKCLRNITSDEQILDCNASVPYELLRFDSLTGQIVERNNVAAH